MADPTALISSSLVKDAYASSRSLANPPSPVAPEGNEFAAMVQDAAKSALETVRTGETTAAAGLRGEATTQDVVEAVLAMQSTVEVAVSVRDRFVEAYQEILRMPI